MAHPRFLDNIEHSKWSFKGISGGSMKTSMQGSLSVFFTCLASNTAGINALCLTDVEDLYDLRYDPGVLDTVIMNDWNLVC